MGIDPANYHLEHFSCKKGEFYRIPSYSWDDRLIDYFARLSQRAFQDEPLYQIIYPNESKRTNQLYQLRRNMLITALLSPQTMFFCTKEFDALAIWLPEERTHILDVGIVTMVTRGGGLPMIMSAGVACLKRLLSAKKTAATLKISFPKYHLFWLVVDPMVQKQGKGSFLMDAFFSMDRENPNWKISLETVNDRTTHYYKRWGFAVVDEVVWQGILIRSMIRKVVE